MLNLKKGLAQQHYNQNFMISGNKVIMVLGSLRGTQRMGIVLNAIIQFLINFIGFLTSNVSLL